MTPERLAGIRAFHRPYNSAYPSTVVAELTDYIDVLTAALKQQRGFWRNISSGPDLDADSAETCPENADAWLAGIAIRAIDDTIGGEE